MMTRREFLEDLMLTTAAAAATAVTSPDGAWSRDHAPSQKEPTSPNESISVAIIGCGVRGRQHIQELSRVGGCRIAYVCDPDRERVAQLAGETEKQQGRAPKTAQDLRRIFDDASIDAVFIATCNHWHALAAIWAMQAGKHVYLEKPVSHTVSEGRRIVQVARKTGRLCQSGTQRRSNGALAAAMAYIREGKLGDVKLARSIIYTRRGSIGGPGKFDVPPTVDYNLWAGPAPMSPLTRPWFHYDWHWFWDTGNGELGNNNIHMADICRWGLGVSGLGRSVISYGGRLGYTDAAETPNTQVVIHDFGDKTIVQETRGLPTEPFSKTLPGGWIFYGSDGIIADTSLFDHDGKLVRTFSGANESHFANFLKAVRSGKREDLNADILEGHLSSALCHIGNISYRLGRSAAPAEIRRELESLDGAWSRDHAPSHNALETFERTRKHLEANGIDLEKTKLTLGPLLHLAPESETFDGNAQANALLTRKYRKPFVVPSEREV